MPADYTACAGVRANMGGHPGQDTDRLAAGREGRVAFASVVLDIPTRALPAPFDYAVPPALEAQAQVGATVLVPFSHRMAVGYVVATSQAPSPDAARSSRSSRRPPSTTPPPAWRCGWPASTPAPRATP